MKKLLHYCKLWGFSLVTPCCILFSCQSEPTCSPDDLEFQKRFDRNYHYVVNNMLKTHEKMDTLLMLCDELMSTSPSRLEPRQLRLWNYSYALSSSVYFNNNDLKKGLACLQRGLFLSDSLNDPLCKNRISSTLTLVYSNWKMNDEANELFNQVIANSDQSDTLSMANAYLAKAMHMVYTMKYDSAVYYMSLIDKLNIQEEDMLPGSYKSVDYTTRFYKGLILSEIPDSLNRSIELLQSLYDDYHAHKEETVSFESVCFRLGKAYERAGDPKKADFYYQEAKDLILTRPVSFQLFETSEPLMSTYIQENDTKNAMQLLPVWKTISEQYYDNQLNGMQAYYSVKQDVAGMEKQILEAEGKLTQRRLEIVILVMVVIVLMLIIVWGIFYWRNKKRRLQTLFQVLMRRYIEWREMGIYLVSKQEESLPLLAVGQDLEATTDETLQESSDSEGTSDDDFYRNLYYRVLLVMEKDRPFLNPELTISLLAKAAITNRTHLSTAINRMTGTNFSTWLAEYRVNYVIHLMTTSGSDNWDMLYEKAGFGSRTSFYRQFKQITGLTPKQFLKQRKF